MSPHFPSARQRELPLGGYHRMLGQAMDEIERESKDAVRKQWGLK